MQKLWRNSLILFAGFIASMTLAPSWRAWLYARLLGLPNPTNRYKIHTELSISMTDGVALRADHYEALGVQNAPTILIRSPYGRHYRQSFFGAWLSFFARRFAERGYHVIIQDVRGRFDSGGEFEPLINEQSDGLDTIAWLREQRWYNGQVGLWGASYLGMVQWAIASKSDDIQAMVPIFTSSDLYPILHPDGVLDLGLVLRWQATLDLIEAVRYRRSMWLLMTFMVEWRAKRGYRHLPLSSVDEVTHGKRTAFFDMIQSNLDPNSDFWQQTDQMVKVSDVNAPVHLFAGWADFFLREQLKDYQRLKEAGKKPSLTIGEWQHFSGLNGLLSSFKPTLSWFDTHLKKQPRKQSKKPINIQVVHGDWLAMEAFPPETQMQTYYLDGNQLVDAPSTQKSWREYTYLPMNPTPAVGGLQFTFDLRTRHDNRSLERRADVLTMTSATLKNSQKIIGMPSTRLYVRANRPTFDILVRLCDVLPDGQSITICDGYQRVTQHDVNEPLQIEFDPIAYQVQKGHQIRLIVASGAHPRRVRNLGTDEPFMTATQSVTTQVTLYTGDKSASLIQLPIYLK